MGRTANALISAKGFVDDGALLVFDGAGTKWVPELQSNDHGCRRI
jgi:hypothetical protein